MKKKKLLLSSALILGISLFTSTVFASSDPLKDLKNRITQLQSQVSSLINQNSNLKKENQHLIESMPKETPGVIYYNGNASGSAGVITVNNKKYVDVNRVVNALTNPERANIDYDKNNIYIGVKPELGGVVDLTKLPIETRTREAYINGFNGSNFKVNHRLFFSGIGMNLSDNSPQNLTYKVDKNYKKLYFKFGLEDKSDDSSKVKVIVYGDGLPMYETNYLSKTDKLKDYSVEISNFSRITFEFVPFDNNANSSPVIIEPIVIPKNR